MGRAPSLRPYYGRFMAVFPEEKGNPTRTNSHKKRAKSKHHNLRHTDVSKPFCGHVIYIGSSKPAHHDKRYCIPPQTSVETKQ